MGSIGLPTYITENRQLLLHTNVAVCAGKLDTLHHAPCSDPESGHPREVHWGFLGVSPNLLDRKLPPS